MVKIEKPEKNWEDTGLGVGKAIISLIPFAGGSINELIGILFSSPIEKRQKKWIDTICSAIEDLEKKSITLDYLVDNDKFIDCVLSLTKTALKTSRKEKLEYLKNFIVNSTLDNDISIEEQDIFVNIIDELTPEHILIIKKLNQIPIPSLEPFEDLRSSCIERFVQFLSSKIDIDNALLEIALRDSIDKGFIDLESNINNDVGSFSKVRCSIHLTSKADQVLKFLLK